MFSVYHILWIGISVFLVAGSVLLIKRIKPSYKTVFTIACVGCALSELIKVFSMIELVPMADGGLTPYLSVEHLPVHLCSIQIPLVFYARFAKPGKARTAILAFMYATCLGGAPFAILLPAVFSTYPAEESFLHLSNYRFFLYHDMIIALAIYIGMSKEIEIKPRHYLSSIALLFAFAFFSLYYNSLFAQLTYSEDGSFVVNDIPNFFYTYAAPIAGIEFTKKWHWVLYVIVVFAIALFLIALLYIPFFVRAARGKKSEKEKEGGEKEREGEERNFSKKNEKT